MLGWKIRQALEFGVRRGVVLDACMDSACECEDGAESASALHDILVRKIGTPPAEKIVEPGIDEVARHHRMVALHKDSREVGVLFDTESCMSLACSCAEEYRGSMTYEHDKGKQEAADLISSLAIDTMLAELVWREAGRTAFAVSRSNGNLQFVSHIAGETNRLLPVPAKNGLLRNGVILLPSSVTPFGDVSQLVLKIRLFIRTYVALSPRFETTATYYVLLTWLYDRFNELPYLRVRGEPGSGKSRFLQVVGSICYRPMFASGASTVSPLFRIIDSFRGTLVFDESDFRFSDEKAEIVKILNNGNAKGFPVLRCEATKKGVYDPVAYHVFGPKLIATRGAFEDRALESRCITEAMSTTPRRPMPVTLPASFHEEALALRNQLLSFRFETWATTSSEGVVLDPDLEPRLNQVLGPLASVMDEEARNELRSAAFAMQGESVTDRGMTVEAEVLEVIRDLVVRGVAPAVKTITDEFQVRHGAALLRPASPRWIGSILRTRLDLRLTKIGGVFTLSREEAGKLPVLYERYGIATRRAVDQLGDDDLTTLGIR